MKQTEGAMVCRSKDQLYLGDGALESPSTVYKSTGGQAGPKVFYGAHMRNELTTYTVLGLEPKVGKSQGGTISVREQDKRGS